MKDASRPRTRGASVWQESCARIIAWLNSTDSPVFAISLDGAGAELGIPAELYSERSLDSLHSATSGGSDTQNIEIVLAHELTPSIARIVNELAPALFIISGPDATPSAIEALQKKRSKILVLGPNAQFRFRPDGRGIHFALTAQQLDQLCGTDTPSRLALCPTPAWLPELIDACPKLQPACGWVETKNLSHSWLQLLELPGGPACIIPLGPKVAFDADAFSPGLETHCLAAELQAPFGANLLPSPDILSALHDFSLNDAHSTADISSLTDVELHAWKLVYDATGTSMNLDTIPTAPPALFYRYPATVARIVAQALERRREWIAWESSALEQDLYIDDSESDVERSLEVLRESAEMLTDHESKVVLKGWGFDVTRQAIAKSASAALNFANKIGYPVALKAISPQLIQKSEANCVALDLGNAATVKRHYHEINDRAERIVGPEQLDGVLVSEMVPSGVDIQIRALRGESGSMVLLVSYIDPRSGVPDKLQTRWASPPRRAGAALRLADQVLPSKLEQRERALVELARSLLRLERFLDAVGHRVLRVELDPLRIACSDDRAPVILDALIEQDAHIQGV